VLPSEKGTQPVHISEGVLSVPVLGAGAAVAAAGVGYGLWKTDYDRVPRVAVLSSAFFVASLIHVPIPGSSIHLILTGLIGLILGWAAFPALFVALLLQAVFFQFGGLTTLGVNVVNMALPAVVCHYLFARAVMRGSDAAAASAAFAAGAISIALAYLLWSACLYTTGKAFGGVILLGLWPHLVVMIVEGMITASAVAFLRKVQPKLLAVPLVGET